MRIIAKLLCVFAVCCFCGSATKKNVAQQKKLTEKNKHVVQKKKLDQEQIPNNEYIAQEHDPSGEYYKLAQDAVNVELNHKLLVNKLRAKIGTVEVDGETYEFTLEEIIPFYNKAAETLQFKENLTSDEISELTLRLFKDDAASRKMLSLLAEDRIIAEKEIQDYIENQNIDINQLSKYLYEAEQRKKGITDIYKLKIAVFPTKNDAQAAIDLYNSGQFPFNQIMTIEHQLATANKCEGVLHEGEPRTNRKDKYIDLMQLYNGVFNKCVGQLIEAKTGSLIGPFEVSDNLSYIVLIEDRAPFKVDQSELYGLVQGYRYSIFKEKTKELSDNAVIRFKDDKSFAEVIASIRYDAGSQELNN